MKRWGRWPHHWLAPQRVPRILLIFALMTAAWSVSTTGLVSATTGVTDELQQTAAADTPTTWYFAEGYTGAGFDEYLTILNPGDSDAAIRITYYLENGEPIVRTLTAPMAHRTTVVVHDPALGVGRDRAVGAKVESTNGAGIVVERPVYFNQNGFRGGHSVLGASSPGSAWYFAEGFTGDGFEEYLTILNPNPSPSPVKLTYYLASGGPIEKTLTVAGNRRATVVVHDAALGVGRGQAVGAKVESTSGAGIVVERPMYFRYGAVASGHNVMGARQPRPAWYFAEGYTGSGFDQYLTILNPNTGPASVKITYFLAAGGPVEKTLTVAGSRRATVAVHDTGLGVGRNQAVGTKVESTNGVSIVVERPMYFTYAGRMPGGHNVLGADALAGRWYFAEGYTGAGFDEYLTILNPNSSHADITVTYYLASGEPVVKQLTALGRARTTINVHANQYGVGRGQAVSARVDSTNGVGIVVERPIYFTYGGGTPGGHIVMGAVGQSPPVVTPTPTVPPGQTPPVAGQPCPSWYHDQIVTTGPDGKLYPTWHPAVDAATGCRFGHEHGDDPRTSQANSAMPAFGYIGLLAGDNEPHVGFKVFVQNAGSVNNDARTLSHHSRMVFHMGTGGPKRFTTRFHSMQYDFVEVGGSGHELHIMGMADTGNVGSICANPRQGRTVVHLPGICSQDSQSLYEIWAAKLNVGRGEAHAAFAAFDPITIMDPADPSRTLLTADYYPKFGPQFGCNREAYSGPTYYYNANGPTSFRTDAYGTPSANGPIVQYVSRHKDLGVKMTTDGTQFQAKLGSRACGPGLLAAN